VSIDSDAVAVQLRAEAAIARVLYAYCDAVDANHTEQIVAIFADDAVFDFGFGRIFTGREELTRLFAQLHVYSATSHHLSNVVIDVPSGSDLDTATARSRVYAFHRVADTGQIAHLWGVYDDVLTRGDSGWVIARRQLRAAAELGADPAPNQSARWEPIPRRGQGGIR
jgi:ketosteroid isomerase-like protein